MDNKTAQHYLKTGFFINSDHQDVISYVKQATTDFLKVEDQLEALYYAVRDDFRYDPYQLDFSKEAMQASDIVKRDYGYCIEKSCLFAAGARILGIPSRLGFANVRNHIGTEKLEAILQTNTLVFHGYAEVYWKDRWIKLTPVFNEALCVKLQVDPLPFRLDGDSIFQEYNKSGNRFMEYIHHYGQFDDIPYDLFINELADHYPHLAHKIQHEKSILLK